MVEYDKSVEVLKNYFALLFPTYYEGEGFAGTILDSLSAGVPIIASDWKYNAEIIKNGETGYLFPVQNLVEFETVLSKTALHPQSLLSMKQDCLQDAENFSPKNVIKIFMEQLQ